VSDDLHRVRRPDWHCATCGSGWPCDGAKKALLDAHRGDAARLGHQLAWCMAVAIDELAVIDPTQLYQRFLGWLLNVNQVCRVCAKPRHDAIPAVPPRLVPCAGRVIEPVRPLNPP